MELQRSLYPHGGEPRLLRLGTLSNPTTWLVHEVEYAPSSLPEQPYAVWHTPVSRCAGNGRLGRYFARPSSIMPAIDAVVSPLVPSLQLPGNPQHSRPLSKQLSCDQCRPVPKLIISRIASATPGRTVYSTQYFRTIAQYHSIIAVACLQGSRVAIELHKIHYSYALEDGQAASPNGTVGRILQRP